MTHTHNWREREVVWQKWQSFEARVISFQEKNETCLFLSNDTGGGFVFDRNRICLLFCCKPCKQLVSNRTHLILFHRLNFMYGGQGKELVRITHLFLPTSRQHVERNSIQQWVIWVLPGHPQLSRWSSSCPQPATRLLLQPGRCYQRLCMVSWKWCTQHTTAKLQRRRSRFRPSG